MTDKDLFNIFRNLGDYDEMSGYYRLKIGEDNWSAINYGYDGGIKFFNRFGRASLEETIYRLTTWTQ
jgi:hypothetical protein